VEAIVSEIGAGKYEVGNIFPVLAGLAQRGFSMRSRKV
jgi:hypothetical protein